MNNIYNKIILSLIVVSSFFTTAYSQEFRKQEFSASLSYGQSALNNSTNIGTSKGKLGGAAGLGYTYFVTDRFGLVSGLEISVYKSEYKADQISNTIFNVADPNDGELFDFYSSINNYKENQTVTYFNIPFQLQYQQDAFGSNKIYALGGIKVGIPIKGKYETTSNSFVNRGYFHETGIWGGDNQEFMGFGTFNDRKSDGDIDLKTSFTLSAEVGVKWSVAANVFLYTGFYLDYGLNNVVSDKDNFVSIKETETGMDFASNSVIASNYNKERINHQFVDKTSLFAGGIKVKIAFGQ